MVRTPEEVEASKDNRELTPWALYVSVLPVFILFGLYILHRKEQRLEAEAAAAEGLEPNEQTGLLAKAAEKRRSSVVTIDQTFSRTSEVARRASVEIMGLTAFDTKEEKEDRDAMAKELQELAELSELEF